MLGKKKKELSSVKRNKNVEKLRLNYVEKPKKKNELNVLEEKNKLGEQDLTCLDKKIGNA